MFKVNQKVVCVDEKSQCGKWDQSDAIFEGQIYTVLRSFIGRFSSPVVHLVEVSRSENAIKYFGDPDLGYGAFRFRPVVERKTSIEVFQKMLTPSPEKVMDELIMETLSDILMANEIHINRFRVQHLHPSDPPANH